MNTSEDMASIIKKHKFFSETGIRLLNFVNTICPQFKRINVWILRIEPARDCR